MTNNNQSIGVLTEQDLISVWASMLKTTQATHVEVEPDVLLFGLINETRTHYTRMALRNPQMQALEDFNRTRWAWKRLRDKVEKMRNR